jgi:hypothetical protein
VLTAYSPPHPLRTNVPQCISRTDIRAHSSSRTCRVSKVEGSEYRGIPDVIRRVSRLSACAASDMTRYGGVRRNYLLMINSLVMGLTDYFGWYSGKWFGGMLLPPLYSMEKVRDLGFGVVNALGSSLIFGRIGGLDQDFEENRAV